jgi:hypothetical protein
MDSDPTVRGRRCSGIFFLISSIDLFRPDHEGTIKQRVLGCGSRVISKIFGKVMVTDADLTLTKKRWCSALTLRIGSATAGCECSLRKAEATLKVRVVSRSRAPLVCRNCANTEGSVTRQ